MAYGGFDATQFNPRAPEQWEAFKANAAQSTRGISGMPYVFGATPGSSVSKYYDMAINPDGSNPRQMVYGSPAAAPAAAAPAIDPTLLQQLLGLVGAGGAAGVQALFGVR